MDRDQHSQARLPGFHTQETQVQINGVPGEASNIAEAQPRVAADQDRAAYPAITVKEINSGRQGHADDDRKSLTHDATGN